MLITIYNEDWLKLDGNWENFRQIDGYTWVYKIWPDLSFIF